jgi:5-methylcytosine-specific restriction endonuclease McrA
MLRNTLIIHAPGQDARQKRREGYTRLMRHPRWRSLRERILNRDGHRCRHCGSAQGLEVHHRQYRLDGRTGRLVLPWEYGDDTLVTLCRDCHREGHRHYRVPCFTLHQP